MELTIAVLAELGEHLTEKVREEKSDDDSGGGAAGVVAMEAMTWLLSAMAEAAPPEAGIKA